MPKQNGPERVNRPGPTYSQIEPANHVGVPYVDNGFLPSRLGRAMAVLGGTPGVVKIRRLRKPETESPPASFLAPVSAEELDDAGVSYFEEEIAMPEGEPGLGFGDEYDVTTESIPTTSKTLEERLHESAMLSRDQELTRELVHINRKLLEHGGRTWCPVSRSIVERLDEVRERVLQRRAALA